MSTAAAAPEAPAAPPAKKGGALKMIVAMLLAAAAAGGGAYFFANQKAASAKPAVEKPADEDAAAEETSEDEASEEPAAEEGKANAPKDGSQGAAAADFFALAPQFVVNLNDPEAMRFLQVEVQIIAKKPSAMEAVKLNDPVVRNRLMLLFSSQTYHALLTREGKEKLQAEATAEINKVLKEHKKPAINGVVFTNFVMQ